jgi:methyl-accepting chemotaxis protein
MFKAFSNIPIFRRLAIVLAVATLVPMLVILLLGSFSLQESTTRSQAVQTSFAAQNIATQEQINLQRLNSLLQARFAQIFAQGIQSQAGGDPSSAKLTDNDVNVLETGFNQALANYRQNYDIATSSNMSSIRNILNSDAPDHGQQIITKQQRALDTAANTAWPTYQKLIQKLLQDLSTHTYYLTAYADFYQTDLGFLDLKNAWQDVVDTATQMGTTVTQVGPSLTTPLLTYTIMAAVFTLLVIIAAGFLINSTIISPLNLLVDLTRKVAQGETEARAKIRGRDEISQVASSINGMLDRILLLMQQAQSRHADLQAQIQKLIGEVSGLGEGNLRIQAQVTSNELGVLASSFNMIVEELNTLVVNVKILASGVQMATLQVFGYMEQLVENADSQLQHTTQAAGEVSHLASSSNRIAERAQVLSDVAREAREAALKGRRSVRQTIEGMKHINENVGATSTKVISLGERSREINNIMEVISNIAQQTNRLALDASVQAAVAGEHGKAFGAVAVDIRRLAERVKEQSALISQIVREVLEDINTASVAMRETKLETATGERLAQEVSNTLELMFTAIERQASEIEVTNQVARQQRQASMRVAEIMQMVADSTRQSSVITRNVTQQIEELAQLAGQLLASVEVFKLREGRPRRQTISSGSNNPTRRQSALEGGSLRPLLPTPNPSDNRESQLPPLSQPFG